MISGSVGLRVLLLTVLISFGACAVTPAGVSDKQVQDAVSQLEHLKEISEHNAYIVQTRFAKDSEILKQAQAHYSNAAAAANAAITRIQFNLTARSLAGQDFSNDIKRITDETNALIHLVAPQPCAPGWVCAAGPLAGLVSADSITKALGALWSAWKDREEAVVNALKQDLEKMRWKSWRDLPVPA